MTVFVFWGFARSGFHDFRLFKLRFGLDIAAAGVAIAAAAVAAAAAAMAASLRVQVLDYHILSKIVTYIATILNPST